MSYRNPLEDELALRDLSARYVDAVNRGDGLSWRATWSEDASWFLMGQEVKGRDNILAFWRQTMELFNFVVMTLNSGTVDIEGNAATGRWYVTEHLSMKGAEPATILGVYDDKYIKFDGQWLIQSRGYHMLYQGAPDLSGTYQPYPPGNF